MDVTLNGCVKRLAVITLFSMAASAAWAQTSAPETRLEYMSVDEINQALDRGQLSSARLVRHLLQRIETLDKNGPAINAIIELNPDAVAMAEAMDRERKGGHIRGPLHGIPVLLKDNIDTSDQMQTSAGSLAMVGQPAAQDAFVVQRLRAAGAVILGKTNLSEWANFRDAAIPSGWSGRGGQTKNPHLLSGDPCGSSSGSAAAVAAGFAPLSVGTETAGSIICPASFNGVVGIKPTVGLLSRSGIIPVTLKLDTPGPIARTVRDAALLLNAMAGDDATDPVKKIECAELGGLHHAVASRCSGRTANRLSRQIRSQRLAAPDRSAVFPGVGAHAGGGCNVDPCGTERSPFGASRRRVLHGYQA